MSVNEIFAMKQKRKIDAELENSRKLEQNLSLKSHKDSQTCFGVFNGTFYCVILEFLWFFWRFEIKFTDCLTALGSPAGRIPRLMNKFSIHRQIK